MKRILIIGPAYPLRGGIAEFNNSLCLAYKKAGYDCKILSFSLQYPKIFFPGKSQYTSDKREINCDIVRSVNSVYPISWLKTVKEIKQYNPDYIITAYWIPFTGISTGFILSRVKKRFKTLALAHNIIPHDRKPLDNTITAFFLKQNKGVVLLSSAVEQELNRFAPDKPRLVAFHPVYEQFGTRVDRGEALKKLNLDDGKYVLFFGLIKKYKGLDVLLKAFASEKLKKSDIKLIVAGEFYDSKEKYLDIIRQEGLEDKIVLHEGFVPDSMVKYYFSVADALILPYHSATQSGVTQIAYHFDLPMIASDVGALPELVPDGKAGFVFEAGKAEQLADAVLRLYDDSNPEMFRKFVEKEKEKFSWGALVEKIDDFADGL